MDQGGRCGVVGERQSEEGKDRVDEDAAHEEVQVIAAWLLQTACWPIHNDRGQILVKVAKNRQAHRWDRRGKDCPHGEVLVDAKWAHKPVAFGATLWPGWLEVLWHVQKVNLHLVFPQLCNQSECQDCDWCAEVRKRLTD